MNKTYKGKRAAHYSRSSIRALALLAVLAVLILALGIFLLTRLLPRSKEHIATPTTPPGTIAAEEAPAETPEETPREEPAEEPAVEAPVMGPQLPEAPVEVEAYGDINPHAVAGTEPSDLIASTEVLVNGEILGSYEMADPIYFDVGSNYTSLDGLFAFRGDNFRSGSAFGTADLTEKTFGSYWTQSITSLTAPDGNTWSGCGWTGQPLIVNWPKSTRQIMNLYDWAKEADELVEVIYATMDGHIYFMELGTGKATRDTLNMGYTFKGSGSIDPRGYPVLYVGAGYQSMNGQARAFAISLIDFSVLFTFGNDDSFAMRNWYCFDASPLVDAETDRLIYPGESGVLYIVDLNTQYDEAAGTLTMDPNIIRWRYQGWRSSTESYWLGVESSPVIFEGHMIMADNGGHLMCLDLSTLTLDWAQDVLDDTNASPVLELEDGHPYVYIAPSFHLGWRSSYTADVPVFKIDAETGEIVWTASYECYSESGVSGGVQGTLAVGKQNLSDYIYVPFARAEDPNGGVLAAIDKQTGEVVWEYRNASYSWGSPTIVYDNNGDGYLLFATLLGDLCMVDGKSGELLDTFNLDAHAESTVAVYENTAVIGTRTNYIYGITLE